MSQTHKGSQNSLVSPIPHTSYWAIMIGQKYASNMLGCINFGQNDQANCPDYVVHFPRCQGNYASVFLIFACYLCVLCAESCLYLLGMVCTAGPWASPTSPTCRPRDPRYHLMISRSGPPSSQVSWTLPIAIFLPRIWFTDDCRDFDR
jgi:hypothetical protein